MLVDLYGNALTSANVAELVVPAHVAREHELLERERQRGNVVGLPSDRCLSRTPDPAWQRELERITAPSERVSRLLIRWHPGSYRWGNKFRKTRWIPVERWIVYQVVPVHGSPLTLRMPYTQTFARRVRTRIRGLDMIRGLVDRVQWELYLETGCYCQPYWVLQGPNGGHRRNYDRQEEQLAQLVGLPTEPPALGALPYIEPSGVTWRRLNELDELRRYKLALDYDRRGAEELDAEEKEARVEMRLALLRHMDEKAYEAVSGHMHEWRAALEQHELPQRVDRHALTPIDYDAAERSFVEHDN